MTKGQTAHALKSAQASVGLHIFSQDVAHMVTENSARTGNVKHEH